MTGGGAGAGVATTSTASTAAAAAAAAGGEKPRDFTRRGPRRRRLARRPNPSPSAAAHPPKTDSKDVNPLQLYVPERAKFVPSRIPAVSAKKQRELAQAIKRARFLGLLPYVIQ